MKSTNKSAQITFIVLGSLFLLFSIIFSTASVYSGKFPVGPELMMLSLSIMAFCNAYLFPQFKTKDERSSVIREKGMFYPALTGSKTPTSRLRFNDRGRWAINCP